MYKLLHKNKHHFAIILYVVVFVVCFALIFALLSGKRASLFTKGSDKVAVDMGNTPWMTLVADDVKPFYQVGDQVVVKLKADSRGVEITGYDALFSYDPSAVEVVSVSSVKETVDIYPHQNADYVSVTGVKRITEASQLIFHDDELISFVIRIRKAGTTAVSIMPQRGNERSKMIDTSTNIIIPQIGSQLSLTVR